MPDFRVSFSNTLLNSEGVPFKVVQRVLDVRRAKTADAAVATACRRFARLERVPDWKLRAHCVEVEPCDRAP